MSNTDSQRLDAMRRQRDGYRNQLRKAEQQTNRHEPTKEKTMTKTFKSAVTITGSRNLLVSADIGMDAGFFLEVRDKHEEPQAICFNNDTAPALALAILEAAGFVGDENMFTGLAVANLRDHVEEQERITAESREQAELEAEALRLANEFYGADWDFFPCSRTVEMQQWLAVARRAREMRAEK